MLPVERDAGSCSVNTVVPFWDPSVRECGKGDVDRTGHVYCNQMSIISSA